MLAYKVGSRKKKEELSCWIIKHAAKESKCFRLVHTHLKMKYRLKEETLSAVSGEKQDEMLKGKRKYTTKHPWIIYTRQEKQQNLFIKKQRLRVEKKYFRNFLSRKPEVVINFVEGTRKVTVEKRTKAWNLIIAKTYQLKWRTLPNDTINTGKVTQVLIVQKCHTM